MMLRAPGKKPLALALGLFAATLPAFPGEQTDVPLSGSQSQAVSADSSRGAESNATTGGGTPASETPATQPGTQTNKNAAESKTASPQAAAALKTEKPAAAATKPIKLYGRIEELCAGPGAKIPLQMKAMVPIRDSSLDEKPEKLTGSAKQLLSGASMRSYPTDYTGAWGGELTVYSVNFDKTYFRNSPEEARKESQMMRPGVKGQYNVNFYRGVKSRIEMQPSQVVFQTTESMSSQMRMMQRNNPQLGALFGNAANPMMANMQVPVMFALHLGAPIQSGEMGVTGNQLTSELMKNTLKELGPGVLENEVVTRDHDRDPQTGQVKTGFSESVLRFTRINRDQLYLQAAYVYYRDNGQFQAKYVLYGTLNRSDGRNGYSQTPYGPGSNPFGGLFPGMGGGANPLGGGTGNLQQQMQQIQNMMQQMNGQ